MKYLRSFAAVVFVVSTLATLAPAWAGEFATKDEAIALVRQAIARVAEIGIDKAKPEFMDQKGKYIDRDLYLVVIDKDGIRLTHGQNPKLVGKSIYEAVDPNGTEYGKEIQRVVDGPGTGWVSYSFKDPITGKILPKELYIEKAGEHGFVAGVYKR